MKVFAVDVGTERPDEDRLPAYAGTLKEAHDLVKGGLVPKSFWPDTTIVERGVQSDKEGVLAALNDAPIFTNAASRTWGITARGGLKEEL